MTAYATLYAAARPYAEAEVARNGFGSRGREHTIQLWQAAYASTAVTQGRTLEEVAARHGLVAALGTAGRAVAA